jgi:hypothetical protein
MDDLVAAGALAIIGLSLAAVLAAAAVIFTFVALCYAAVAGDAMRVAAILVIILFFLAAYAGTGLWLRMSGRI